MSSVSELLAELRARNVTLSARDGKLKLTGQAAALTAELKQRITHHKAELLVLLGDVASAQPEGSPARLTRRTTDAPRPLSYVQERLWFVERINPGTALHNIGLALRWQGPLDQARLRDALSTIVRRHEVLRSRIVTEGDLPRQIVARAAPVALPLDRIEAASPKQREAALAQRRACRTTSSVHRGRCRSSGRPTRCGGRR
jgi:hypothetical protein